ncbi:uncharacterized protein LOC144882865 [Branchiostoma floridae x Branchiostoma japonicum]
MERFVGKWCLSDVDFDKLKTLYVSKMGTPEAVLEDHKEQWMKTYMNVTENGTHWTYGNVPGGDTTMMFDKADQTCKLISKRGAQESTFEMKGDAEIFIQNSQGLKITIKVTGQEMKVTQALDDVSVDTVYTKSSE